MATAILKPESQIILTRANIFCLLKEFENEDGFEGRAEEVGL